MAIKWGSDLGAPVAVTAVDLITEATQPTWNEWAAYILTVGGYIGGFMGCGGDFVKNMGIASFPWAGKKIYNRVVAPAASRSSRMTLRKAGVSRYPGSAQEAPFQGVKLV